MYVCFYLSNWTINYLLRSRWSVASEIICNDPPVQVFMPLGNPFPLQLPNELAHLIAMTRIRQKCQDVTPKIRLQVHDSCPFSTIPLVCLMWWKPVAVL